MANAEMVVVPGATRLFDGPAALRVLSERSVDWFKKTLAGDDPAEETVRERMSHESKRRLAAVASLFLMAGFALAPKANSAITAFFDETGSQNAQGFAGHLGIAVHLYADGNVTVGVDAGNVTILSGASAIPITDSSVPGSGTAVTVPASSVRRIVLNGNGQIDGPLAGQGGRRVYDLSSVSATNGFTGIPTILGTAGATVGADNGTATNYYVLVSAASDNGTVLGSAFSDSLLGAGSPQTIVGGLGDDRIMPGLGADSVDAGDGDDYIDLGSVNANGSQGRETLFAGAGNDTIRASENNSTVDGGDGIDQMIKPSCVQHSTLGASAGNSMTITPGTVPGSGTIFSSNAGVTTVYTCAFSNVEIPGMAGFGDFPGGTANSSNCADSLNMSGWNGTLGAILSDGNSGNDTLIGSAGPDTLTITYQNDSVAGGDGDDLLILNPNAFNALVDIRPTIGAAGDGNIGYLFSGNFTTGTQSWNDTIAGIERFILNGGGFNDTTDATMGDTLDISGVSLPAAMTVNGNNGRDSIVGSAIGDVLNGNNQNDTILGGDGNDTISGGSQDDLVDGQSGNDSVDGGADADQVLGGAGDDTLDGNTGNDAVLGGADNDLYIGLSGVNALTDDSGTDTIDLSGAENGALVQIGSLNISDTAGNSLSAAGIEDVIGTTLDDRFVVALGGTTSTTAMYLDGNAGNDTLQYDPSGLTNVNNATADSQTLAGSITADGAPAMQYVNMEDVLIRQLVSGARVWQEFE
ncbi:MAG: calcium-binding protein [Candidatus Sumerlaeota bacterium]|nr:calcium-binding protein [Candidatus Sumerlaeota bacterium]